MKRKPIEHFWLKLYFKDWHNSQPMMLSSCNARGVAIEAEMLMKQSPVPGCLLLSNGTIITPELLARHSTADLDQVISGLNELVDNGEFTIDKDGAYHCERVRRNAERAQRGKINVARRPDVAKNLTSSNTSSDASSNTSTSRSTRASDSDSDSDSKGRQKRGARKVLS